MSENKDDKKRQYKDYVNFLDNYKQGKHEPVDDVGEMTGKSFKDYLENYSNKMYQPVQPAFVKHPDKRGAGKGVQEKLVRTEVFIQIDQQNTAPRITKTFQLSQHKQGEQTREPSRHNEHQQENNIYETTKISLRKTPSIKETRRLFEENQDACKKPSAASNKPKQTNGTSPNKKNIHFLNKSPERKLVSDSSAQLKAVQTIVPAPASLAELKKPEPPKAELKKPEPPKAPVVVHAPSPPCIPPPPPMPSTTPIAKSFVKPVAFTKPVASAKVPAGYSTLPKSLGRKEATETVPKLDKNDPRVKKLVYGALREMYGTYHDKANDYLATLPKSRVKRSNGLDSIINSIASQGGLDKLSGRMNPKLEVE